MSHFVSPLSRIGVALLLTRARKPWNAYAAVVRNPRFFPLWLSQLVSNLGDTFNYIALVIMVFRITNSGVALAIVSICQIVAVIIISPIAGVVVDRYSRKAILISADVVRGLLMLLLIVADQTNQILLVYISAALLAVASSFFRPAFQAVIPLLLSEGELLAANSVAWSTEQLVQIVASALAGGLVLWAGTTSAFTLNAFSFFISAALISKLTIPDLESPVKQGGGSRAALAAFTSDLKGGLDYVRRTLFISRLLVVQMLASLAVGGTSALLIVLSTNHLKLPAAGFSLLLLAIGGGALIGPLVLNAVTNDLRNPRLLFVPYLVRGVGDILIALFTPLPLALALLFIYGLSTSTGMVTYNSFMQASVPERVRGRVYTLFDATWSMVEIASLGLAGWLNDLIGIQGVYYIGGSLLIAAGLLGLTLLPYRLLVGQRQGP